MNSVATLFNENVYPFFCCAVKHKSYFKYFTLCFLFLDSLFFLTSFAASIINFNPMSLLTVIIRAGLILAMAKTYFDFNKTGKYGTTFAYYYALVRVVYIFFSLALVFLKSMIWGAFSILFFPVHHHKRHYLFNGIVALIIFVSMVLFSLYLNCLYLLVIKKQRNQLSKTNKAPLNTEESNVTES